MTTDTDQATLLLLRMAHDARGPTASPGVTVLEFVGFDIGIDACDDNPANDCPGVRVFVYRGDYYDGDGYVHGAFTLHGTNGDGRDPMPERNPRMEGPFLHSLEAEPDSVSITFRNGAALLVTDDGHVFGYWTDDGDACTHIVHTQPAAPDCDEYGCDPRLVTTRQSVGLSFYQGRSECP